MTLVLLIVVGIVIIVLFKILSKTNKTDSKPKHQEFPKIEVTFTVDGSGAKINPNINSNDLWIPKDQEVIVKSYKIPGGLIYVGKDLAAVNSYNIEPALIDPELPVNSESPDYYASSFSYWPSYSSISPEARAAYLEWLSHARATWNTPIGYVFLFFYGLERRLLLDLQNSSEGKPEAEVIIKEVERLLNIYGSNPSFANYASNFLTTIKLKFEISNVELTKLEATVTPGFYPIDLKVRLGRFAINKTPIPLDWALKWLEHSENVNRSTVYTRCGEEFKVLFKKRYLQFFGEGMVIEPNKTKLSYRYRPASASFSNTVEISVDNIPDLTRLSRPVNRLKEIYDGCIAELEAYSRFIGRNPDLTNTYQSLSLLPSDVLLELTTQNLQDLKTWLNKVFEGRSECVVDAKELIEKIDHSLTGSKISQTQAASIGQLLSKLGYGMEPDARFGINKISQYGTALLFKLVEDVPAVPSKEYLAASLMLYMAILLSTADESLSSEEEKQIESHLNSLLDLSEGERQRLKMYVKWLKLTKPDISGLKKLFGKLDKKQKVTLADFLVFVASADGQIHPKEIEVLRKTYKLLELDPEQVYSDVHSIQTNYSNVPVTVMKDENQPSGYKIPRKKEGAGSKSETGISLDHEVIDRKLIETLEIQSILSDIFIEGEEKGGDAARTPKNGVNEMEEHKPIKGLDKEHSVLLTTIAERPEWERSQFEEICRKLGLMPDGAIETINETAYDLFEENLIEEYESLEINQKVLKELTIG